MALTDFPHAQGIVQRQRMRHTGLIDFWRHDPDVVGKRARNFFTSGEPRRMNAVVIGNENAPGLIHTRHGRACPGHLVLIAVLQRRGCPAQGRA